MANKRTACAECPFSPKSAPGATGGSNPAVYVGQAFGPFLLSCHMATEYYDDPASPGNTQCAGAAQFRANVGVDELMPPQLLHLPPDKDAAFPTPAALIAHHAQCSLKEAEAFLAEMPPEKLRDLEMSKRSVKVLPKRDVCDGKNRGRK